MDVAKVEVVIPKEQGRGSRCPLFSSLLWGSGPSVKVQLYSLITNSNSYASYVWSMDLVEEPGGIYRRGSGRGVKSPQEMNMSLQDKFLGLQRLC